MCNAEYRQDRPDAAIAPSAPALYCAAYASDQYLQQHDFDSGATARWIDCAKRGDYPLIPAKGAFPSLLLQFEAAKAGMGTGMLPCFMGDP